MGQSFDGLARALSLNLTLMLFLAPRDIDLGTSERYNQKLRAATADPMLQSTVCGSHLSGRDAIDGGPHQMPHHLLTRHRCEAVGSIYASRDLVEQTATAGGTSIRLPPCWHN